MSERINILIILFFCLFYSACYRSNLEIYPLKRKPSILRANIKMSVNSLGKAKEWTQLNLTISNTSPYSLELKTHNVLLTYDGGKILRPLDQAELIMKITQEAGKFSSLTVIPFVGSLVAIQQLIVNNRVRGDSDDIINTSLKDIDIPPRMSIRGNIYFPAVVNVEELIVHLKRDNSLIKFRIPLTQTLSDKLAGGKSLPEAQVLYEQAYAWYKAASYQKAIYQFNKFLKDFPQHDLADNAQYWIGESYYSLELFPRAIYAFQRVITYYPKGNKAPDALLKIGMCYLATKDKEKARATFQKLVAEYPASNAARLAHMELEEN